jgi:hypothetical protein
MKSYTYMHKTKEVIKEQPSAVNLSATVWRVLQGKNVANQKPPFWNQLTQLFHHN